MKIVGLDIATKTGLYFLDQEDPRQNRGALYKFPKEKGLRRVQSIARGFTNFLELYRPELAVIEGFAYGNKNSLVDLVEVATPIKLALLAAKVPWYLVPPTTLKLWTTGSGKADKDGMAAAVKERWGFESEYDDVVDAYALTRIGEVLVSGADPALLKKVQYLP